MKSLILLAVCACAAAAWAAVPLESRNASALIVGGEKASQGQFPYQVRLFIQSGIHNGICGGSIINKKYILTAAHCVYPPPLKVTVNVGYLDTDEKSGRERDYVVDRINNHLLFKRWNFENDISILRVKGEIEMSDIAQPVVRFAEPGQNYTGPGVGSGFGTLKEKDPPSNHLMWVDLPILGDNGDTICNKQYRLTYNQKLMLCAGYMEGGKDTCQGDSGGPLMQKGTGVQVGIVSHGNGCGRKDYPGVYTKVAAYKDWIEKNSRI